MTLALRRLIERVSPRLSGAASCPVGVHVGGERLTAAQFERTPSGPVVHAVGTLDLGGPWYATLCEARRFRHALRHFWKEQGFRGSDVIAAMPQEQLKVFTVDYTATQGQAEADAIAAEVKDRLKANGRSMVVDFVPVRQANQDERNKEAVVAAAAREDVTAFLDLLDAAGLRVQALDVAGMALKRVVPWTDQRGGRDSMGSALLVHIGAEASQLMLVWGRRLMLDRSIEFSEQRLVSRVAKLLELPEHAAKRLLAERDMDGAVREIIGAELLALKTEAAKTLHYAASKMRGADIDKILVVGAVGRFPGIAQFLRAGLGKPVEVLDPLALFPHHLPKEEASALSPQYGVAVAMGLALRGMPGPVQ
jgi:type IV pilus assembly protein PilM